MEITLFLKNINLLLIKFSKKRKKVIKKAHSNIITSRRETEILDMGTLQELIINSVAYKDNLFNVMNDYDEDMTINLMGKIVDKVFGELYKELIETKSLDIGDYTLYIEKGEIIINE